MADPVWGALQKSQVDPATIDEEIDTKIQDHLDDPDAHIEAGQSLQSHKASVIIDHVARSVLNDKIETSARAYTAIVDINGGGDYVDIQDAIDYVYSLGGGNILVLPGTYSPLLNIELKENVIIEGFDSETTIIDLTPSTISTGHIGVVEGEFTITGIDTQFITDGLKSGDTIYIPYFDDYWFIDSVDSETELTVTSDFSETIGSLDYTGYLNIDVRAGSGASNYSTGTITATNGSDEIVGAGTSFLSNITAGDYIFFKDVLHKVAVVTDNTHLDLSEVYLGKTQSSLPYYSGPFVSNIGIKNITIKNSGAYFECVKFWNVRNSFIDSNYIINGGGGVFLDHCDSVKLSYNDLSYHQTFAYYGLLARYCSNLVVSENYVISNYDSGLYFWNMYGGNFISHNNCSFNGSAGIDFYNVSINPALQNSIVDNNCCANGSDGILLYKISTSIVSRNICLNNTESGIELSSVSHCSVVSNVVDGNSGHNIYAHGSSGYDYNIISDNQVLNSGDSGIYIDCDYNILNGNICKGNTDHGIEIIVGATKNIVVANVCLSNSGGNLDDAGTSTELGHNITA